MSRWTNRQRTLNCAWQDGNKVFSGGADNAGRMLDLVTGQPQQVAQHDAAVKVVKWVDSPQGGFLVTGSWDKTLKVPSRAYCPRSLLHTTDFVILIC